MRAKSMILILIALGCGLVASIGISQHLERGAKTVVSNETEKIFVAMAAIDIGQPLTAENVKLEEWPRDKIPQGAVKNLEDLKDRFARQRLFSGEPILEAKLMNTNEADSTKIPAGYRVASVNVTMESGVAGLVQPGDRVDLVVFLKRGQDVAQTGVKTILRDVRVFAVNQETERSTDTDGQPIVAKTVSFLVTPRQVERLMLAGQLGKLHLSLRRPNDGDQQDEMIGGLTVEQLLGEAEQFIEPATRETAAPPETNSGLLSWLSQQATQPALPAAASEPAWKMVMYTPQGTRQFQWESESGLPQEIGADAPAGGVQPPADNAAASSTLIGQSVNLAGTTFEGDSLHWSSYQGKVVLVAFWASWCKPCMQELPALKTLHSQYASQGVDVVGVNLDKEEQTLSDYLEGNPQPWSNIVGADAQQIATQYGVRNLPTVLLVNQRGEVVAVESSSAKLAAQIDQLVQGGNHSTFEE